MRKIFWFGALFLGLVGAILLWRARHPRLSDTQQIAANLDNIVAAANERQAGGIIKFLAPDFKWQGGKRKDFQSSLVGGILQYRVIDLGLSGLKTGITGNTATTSGGYRLSLKSEFNSPAEITTGNFQLKWRKKDGEWLIVGVEGASPSF